MAMSRRLLPALLILTAGSAAAEGWSIYDFGVTVTREECMLRAEKVLETYIRAYGGYDVTKSEWITYGWDLTPGDQDVVIMCPVLPDGSFYSFLVVYGETDNDAERETTAERLNLLWGG